MEPETRKPHTTTVLAVIAVVLLIVLVLLKAHKNTETAVQDGMNADGVFIATQPDVTLGGAAVEPGSDIITNASASENLTTFIAAVQAAGLTETLKGAGPYTVFAPTDAAFAKIPKATLDSLLKPENKEKLARILTYHVVSGKYKAADLTEGMELTTVQGQKIVISKKNNVLVLNDLTDASLVQTSNAISSNGVIFVVDTVLMPK